MPEEMQKRAVALAEEALNKHSVLRDIAGTIKKDFDKEYGSTWHCVVGKSFGSYVTHRNLLFLTFM
jgi:dynein light chain LC8-type